MQSPSAHELRTLIFLSTGDTLVVVEACELPVITGSDVGFVVRLLSLKAFKLCIGICGDAAVGGYPDLLERLLCSSSRDFCYFFKKLSLTYVYTSL